MRAHIQLQPIRHYPGMHYLYIVGTFYDGTCVLLELQTMTGALKPATGCLLNGMQPAASEAPYLLYILAYITWLAPAVR